MTTVCLSCDCCCPTDTGITVGFRVPSVDVPESAGNATLIAEVTGGQLNRNVTLQYNTADGSALGEYNRLRNLACMCESNQSMHCIRNLLVSYSVCT